MTQTVEKSSKPEYKKATTLFQYLIKIKPLGLLYGSAGRFLSPENLVGRSGNSFPPSAATLSGIFAAEYWKQKNDRNEDSEESKKPDPFESLQLAGAFWAYDDDIKSNSQDFYVPTPMNCLVKDSQITSLLTWNSDREEWQSALPRKQQDKESDTDYARDKYKPKNDKYQKGSWLKLSDWGELKPPKKEVHSEDYDGFPKVITQTPWQFLPHLHPRLAEDQRCVDEGNAQGSLFLENSVQMKPDVSLVYLSSMPLENGWYRFGGEGHLVEIESIPLSNDLTNLLNRDVGNCFATITPAIWGSNRKSYREPVVGDRCESVWYPSHKADQIKPILVQRPSPMRYRLGNYSPDGETKTTQPVAQAKRLSRGRYAVPPGAVYVVDRSLPCWQNWDEEWFPKEAYSFKRWGCGLALPLPV